MVEATYVNGGEQMAKRQAREKQDIDTQSQ